MELTPELFETTEFAERRKGYDIEQVETFMEQAGTALAQMLARVRHTEERAAAAEARLSQAEGTFTEAEERVRRAESRVAAAERAANEASQAAASAQAHQGMSEDAEVEQAAKTLLMAKRTAEATVNEARGQAQSLLEEAQSRSRRQLDEAGAEATELVRRAGEQAEAEYADRRAAAIEQVETLEGRRAQLADVIGQLESRLAGYREELARVASEITGIAEDPERLGARPTMTLLPDEVLAGDRDPDDVPPGEDADRDPGGSGRLGRRNRLGFGVRRWLHLLGRRAHGFRRRRRYLDGRRGGVRVSRRRGGRSTGRRSIPVRCSGSECLCRGHRDGHRRSDGRRRRRVRRPHRER